MVVATYGDLFLRDDYGAVLASHAQRCDVRCRDCLECIFCVAAMLAGVVGESYQAARGAVEVCATVAGLVPTW